MWRCSWSSCAVAGVGLGLAGRGVTLGAVAAALVSGRAVVGLAVAMLYAVFSGWGVPAQRTVWMLAVVALLLRWGSRWTLGP